MENQILLKSETIEALEDAAIAFNFTQALPTREFVEKLDKALKMENVPNEYNVISKRLFLPENVGYMKQFCKNNRYGIDIN